MVYCALIGILLLFFFVILILKHFALDLVEIFPEVDCTDIDKLYGDGIETCAMTDF